MGIVYDNLNLKPRATC